MEKTGSKPTDLTDQQLVEMAAKGDQRAFSLLLVRYKDALLRFVLNIVPVLVDAEDICQKSFGKAFMNIDRYNPAYAFSTWLYNIARNESIDHLRRNQDSIGAVSITDDPKVLDISVSGTPEEQVIVDQAVARIVREIGQLPELYREVAELRFIKDYAYEDISSETGLALGTVKTRIRRARAMLVKTLEKTVDETDR
ncbi:MAG: sigma-70 family RNA polymerase sigma factor [Bacteroidales bacterium]|nr:sigma-70 family RNA polymerase sigma factor [Bacteroidales bacterium]